MSTSVVTSPFSNQSDLFAVNGRLVPVVIVLFGLIFSALFSMCVLSALHRRRLRVIANDPRTIALARERARNKEELERGPPIPRMKTVNVEIDLEIGHGVEKGEEGWRGFMPLSLEFSPDYPSSPSPYDDSRTKSMTPPQEEPKYVRLTVLVALPSTSERRHRRENVILDATLADARGRPLVGDVECVQHELPEAAIGIYQEKYTSGAL